MVESTPTDSVLLRLAKDDDPEAWQRLVQIYGPLVNYWLRQHGVKPADREDLFQQVFLSVSSALREFQANTFRGWIRTITRNKVIDHVRRMKGSPAAVGGTDFQKLMAGLTATEGASDRSDSESSETGILLRSVMDVMRDAIEPKTWSAFWRTAIDDVSAPDVADELGMTPDAVRQARCRVLRKLKQEFGDILL